jgi:hypothetical protein
MVAFGEREPKASYDVTTGPIIARVWGNVYPIWKLLDHIAKDYLSATYSRVSSLLVQHQLIL